MESGMDDGLRRQLIVDCEQRARRLTEWEGELIHNLRVRLEHGLTLTEKQEAALERTWERVTADG
jgi:hypothetical protein